MTFNKMKAEQIFLVIERKRDTFFKTNWHLPNNIKINKDIVKMLVAYNESIVLNFEVGNPKTIMGMEVEETNEDIIQVY